MFTPKKFKQLDVDLMVEAIRDNPLGSLISHSDFGLVADHLPFVYQQTEAGAALIGHIARVNELWKNIPEGADVLVLFHGPNCYISPSYYPTKMVHGRAVPTWNYVVVHVRGTIHFSHQSAWNRQALTMLTEAHEATRSDAWTINDAPSDYVDKMLSAIVGIEIQIQEITGNWKLSQNQPVQNRQGVISGLEADNSVNGKQVAELMRHYSLTEPK